ncbi:MAG: SDR family oxidoreductase [Janthinobacterium lividum]
MILALTGATGFVGSHLLDRALAQGHRVRALTRRPQPLRVGVTWVDGALDRPDGLAALVAGADATIHVAGVVNAPDRAGFAAGNAQGTAAMLAAAADAGVRRFVHVSSLAAREPGLSDYGWSKAEAERLVAASALDWTIVRPPAIFGPRDTELLELFRLARRRVVPLPPAGGRLSVIAVGDLSRLLLDLATTQALVRASVDPDDGRPDGWDHRDFARAIGDAVGARVVPLPLPGPVLAALSRIEGALRGPRAKLTADRVRYFCHPDWVAHDRPPADVWVPQEDTPAALAATAAWYRGQGLL